MLQYSVSTKHSRNSFSSFSWHTTHQIHWTRLSDKKEHSIISQHRSQIFHILWNYQWLLVKEHICYNAVILRSCFSCTSTWIETLGLMQEKDSILNLCVSDLREFMAITIFLGPSRNQGWSRSVVWNSKVHSTSVICIIAFQLTKILSLKLSFLEVFTDIFCVDKLYNSTVAPRGPRQLPRDIHAVYRSGEHPTV